MMFESPQEFYSDFCGLFNLICIGFNKYFSLIEIIIRLLTSKRHF